MQVYYFIMVFAKKYYFLLPFFLINISTYSQLQIVSPLPGDTLNLCKEMNITWTGNNDIPVKLEYSTNVGKGWITIAENLSGTSYKWVIPYLDTTLINLKISLDITQPPYLIWIKNQAHSDEIRTAKFSPDGNYILSSSKDNTVKIWDISSSDCIDSIKFTSEDQVNSAFWLHGTDSVLIAVDSMIFLWVRISKSIKPVITNYFNGVVRQCPPHPVKNVFCAASYDGKVGIFDISTGQVLHRFTSENSDEIYSCSFSPDGKFIIYSTSSGKVYIADWENDTLAVIFAGHRNVVWNCNLSYNNKFAVSGGVENNIKLWDIENKSEINTFSGHSFHVRSVSFSPDGEYILSGSLDGTVRQWSVKTGAERTPSINHSGQVIYTEYSATADTIVSTGRDKSIKLWRNFQHVYLADSISNPVKLRLRLQLPDLRAFPGNGVLLPLELADVPDEVAQKHISFKGSAGIIIPNKLLDIISGNPIFHSISGYDTINVSFDSFIKNQNLTEARAVALYNIISFDSLKLVNIIYDAPKYMDFEADNGSIEVLPSCAGDTIITTFLKYSLSMNVAPNPVKDAIDINLSSIEDGKYEIWIINMGSGNIAKSIKMSMKAGIYNLNIKLDDLPDGNYILQIQSPSESIAKKISLLK